MKTKLLALLFSLIASISFVQVNEQDSLALVALYNSTDGSNWCGCHENWLTAPVSEWWGINVSNGRVIEIRLYGGYMFCGGGCVLNGDLPQELGNLSALKVLDLQYNSEIHGNIPLEIGQLDSLYYLNISFCSLSGSIPTEIGNLNKLQELYLHGNELTGNIPPEIGQVLQLQKIDLSNNQLIGSIPPRPGNML